MDINPNLTIAHSERMRHWIAATPPGMAHWSGTGPKGRSCRECVHFINEGYYAASNAHSANGLKPGRCRKYTALMGFNGKKFQHRTASCSHFEENSEPPKPKAAL